MGNLTVNKLIIECAGNDYVIEGGLTPGVPIPIDTVDSGSIVDGSIATEDLSDEVQRKLNQTYEHSNRTLYINGARP